MPGGDRKKTSIGMEVITYPAVLFLGEPTIGLDARPSNAGFFGLFLFFYSWRRCQVYACLDIFFDLPLRTIFMLFDRLTLLALGKVMFYGSV